MTGSVLRPYVAFFAARFRSQLQYRAAAWAGVGTQVFFGLVSVMVLAAFYRAAGEHAPLTQSQAISYVWLGQALLLILPFRLDPELRDMIKSGDVAYELARPVFLPLSWLVRGFADRTAPVLLRAVPQFIFSMLLLPLVGWEEIALIAPIEWSVIPWFLLSAFLGSLVAAAIGLISTATMFWTIAGQGTATLVTMVVWVMSGVNVPLPLYPEWLQPAIRVLPFRAMLDTPFQIYLGTITPRDIVPELVLQLVWAIALFVFAWFLIARGARRVVVQGG